MVVLARLMSVELGFVRCVKRIHVYCLLYDMLACASHSCLQILQSWQALAMPFSYRCAFVLGTNSANSSSSSRADCAAADNSSSGDGSTPSTTADAAADAPQTAAAAAASQGVHQQAPWSDRAQCQAHIALLACLHQYHEDEPAAAEQQWEVLADEGRVIEAGLALLPAE